MRCPTPCVCGEIVELHDMREIATSLPTGGNLVCTDCYCEDCEGTGELMSVECYGGPPVEVRVVCAQCDGLGYREEQDD